jgi:sphingomyelin phosphodiesterase acid-like 3
VSRSLSLALLATVLALLAARPAVSDPVPGGDFLALSDIHFDALADPALVDQLAAAPARNWPALLARSASPPSRFGQDTNWPLLRSALQAMRAAQPHPAFLLVPGDFLAHTYRQRFNKSTVQPTEATYRSFVVKSIQFVAEQLQAAFPGTPVLPVLGNNDADCGDYQLQPGGPFLRDTLPIVRALLRGGFGPEFDAGWTATGNYNVAHPTLPGVRVVFANAVFFSLSYRNACGGGDPATATLDWLQAQLERARRDGGKIWLIYHIPPGVDVYATLRKPGCADAVAMWEEADAARFAALVHDYADVITASFAGHTHRDEFRLTGPPGGHDGFVLIVPALSPVYGQNPAFQVFDYDAAGEILDVATHYVANLDAAAGGSPIAWQTEPSFTAEWQLPRLDLTTLETLQERIGSDREAGTTWLLRYGVSRTALWPLGVAQGLVPDDVFRAYSCAIGSGSAAGYQTCRCAAPR